MHRFRRISRRPGQNIRRPDEDVRVTCDVTSQRGKTQRILFQNNLSRNIRVTAKPNDKIEFHFKASKSNNRNLDLQLISTEINSTQGEFVINDDQRCDEASFFLKKVKCICKEAGDLEMSITFKVKDRTLREIAVCKNVIVNVENNTGAKASPYQNKKWTAEKYIHAVEDVRSNMYDVPRKLRAIIVKDANMKILEQQDSEPKYRNLMSIMKLKRIEGNFKNFYHHLLWLDEIKELENIEKYNMSAVVIKKELKYKKKQSNENSSKNPNLLSSKERWFKLEVPGLSQKRPSLMIGDRAIISRYDANTNVVEYEHEGYIKKIKRNDIFIDDLDASFEKIFNSNTRFSVRFITNRAAIESQHRAVESHDEWRCRLFPEPVPFVEPQKIGRFFNPHIGKNAEQKATVEHILSRTSGLAPYLVWGPPGTGKTTTIVESIIQIVAANPRHRVWVATNSNTAADHVALQLLKYQPLFDTNTFLLRANSKDRDWKSMPVKLREVSNGNSREKCESLDNEDVSTFRIVVTTLLHAAKFTKRQHRDDIKIKVSHLFIDEAAQATEPSCLVPMELLANRGQLVLAGDPCQLGPVIMSKLAKEFGLGMSLMEHLYNKFSHLYGEDCPLKHQYITMLVNNFRSDADILAIPNEQFYGGKLKALAPLDPLSRTSILGKEGGDRSIVFHFVNSKAQKLGRVPSYMNNGEFKMIQTYITALIGVHKVPPKDIGVISPYIRQVAVIKEWLLKKNYTDLEVGTVEAFQGKEKRVVLVSTVRGGGKPTGNLRADLGFLVDKQRFNVAVTRAKAKLIVIGNKLFLKQDELWNRYIQRCEGLGTFHVETSPALERLVHNLSIDDCDEPSFSPELDDCFGCDDEPSFSPELDDCFGCDDEPSFSPELDDCFGCDDEPSFSPELDDCFGCDDEPSFSPEQDFY